MEGMNQPHQVRGQQAQYDNTAPSTPNSNNRNIASSWLKPSWESKFLIALLIVVALLLVTSLAFKTFSEDVPQRNVNQDSYQAVFLSNGQVYFGKITGMNRQTYTLEDIYYLQVDQQLQPEETEAEDPQVSLVKLGDELHGPEDVMYISSNEVIFWENLKDDGQVSQAIDSYTANGNGDQQGNSQPANPEDTENTTPDLGDNE